MDVQLVCNHRVATYNKLLGIKPMGLSDPWDEYIDVFPLHPVKKYKG